MQADFSAFHAVRELASTTVLYARAARRVRMHRHGPRRHSVDDRLVFVVGCPRSGTTFTAAAIGALHGFVDLSEVHPVKAAAARLASRDPGEAAAQLRRILQRLRTLTQVRDVRGVEQTPEMAFLVEAALRAYPRGRVVHVVRDGRDVAASLLERGWLGRASGRDDVGAEYGGHARFWVEPDRADEFARTSEARRAGWAWRRYVSAARGSGDERVLEVRYERLAGGDAFEYVRLARHLDVAPDELAGSFRERRDDRSIGRWRRALDDADLAEVEGEAGPLLRELGYG